MAKHLETGSFGEQAARDYLISFGYLILVCNFRTPFGEIDIISRDPDGTLVIVEVKTLSRPCATSPEDNLTQTKFRKLSKVASFYANANPQLLSPSLGFRIDLVAITLDPYPDDPTIIKIGKHIFAISHYKNIFY